MATTTSISPSSTTLLSLLDPKPNPFTPTHRLSLSFISPITISSKTRKINVFHLPPQKHTKNGRTIWRFQASTSEILPSETTPLETSQQIVSSGGDSTATVISALLFVAFVGLSILTVGVIYIAVTDFLQNREKEKFEKEEKDKKKRKSGKKMRQRMKTGPRGFGQKIEEDDVDD